MAQNVNDIINGGGAVYNSVGRPLESGSGMEGSKALKKGPWTATEDQVLTEYVRKHGEGNWNSVQRNSGLNRCGKSCRLRWANHLRPNLKKGAFTPEEERLILELHAKYGNKWARMASQLPGRTDNEIKNYWNTRVKRRQRQGLPLYPHDIKQSQQQSHSHSHSQQITTTLTQASATTTMPPTSQPLCFQYPTTSLSQIHQLPSIGTPTPPHHSLPVFDPATTNASSFTFHRPDPTLGASLCYKRYRDTLGFSPPLSPTSQRSSSIFRTSLMPDISSSQHFSPGNISMPDMSSFQFQPLHNYNGTLTKFDFGDSLFSSISRTRSPYLVKSELPPTQVLLTKEVPSSQVSQTQQSDHLITNDTNKVNVAATANDIHCSNGLLEELLQEDEAFASNANPRKAAIGQLGSFEEKHVLDGYGRWLASSSTDTSLSEVKPIQDHHGNGHINSVHEDLSKLFSFIPSTEPILDWYNSTDSSGELSNGGQSSGVTKTSLEFDMQQQMASLFPAASSTDHDIVPNHWDNLPGIC